MKKILNTTKVSNIQNTVVISQVHFENQIISAF